MKIFQLNKPSANFFPLGLHERAKHYTDTPQRCPSLPKIMSQSAKEVFSSTTPRYVSLSNEGILSDVGA